MSTLRLCKKCGEEKPLEEFSKHPFGHRHTCFICMREHDKIRSREYRKNNPEISRAAARNWRINNSKKMKATIKKWEKNNPEKIKAKRKRMRDKNKNNLQYRLNNTIRAVLTRSLKRNNGSKNGRHWEDLVGYTISDLRMHLEKQFAEGMSWDNYGDWHIDHIIPISVFNFSSPEHIDFKRCWTLDNLQPMWAKENRIKQDKLEQSFQPSLAM